MAAKRLVLRLLFFILFSFYTISPISYAYTSENVGGNIHNSGETHSLSKKISIYLWDLFYTQLASKDGADDTDSTAMLLLKKKRAIIPKNLTPTSAHLENFSLTENYFVLPSCSPIMVFIESSASKPFRGARSLHSGLSPPLL